MRLTLCNFQKRLNSTKQPTSDILSAGKTYEYVSLKELTNIDNPILKLAGASGNEYAYNYAYVHDWGRYYHIKTADIRHEDIYFAKLELDDLATYKTQILTTDAYVIYSSSSYNNWIRDDRTPIVARPPEIVMSYTTPIINDHPVFVHTGVDIDDETVILTTYSQNVGIAHWLISEGMLDYIMNAMIQAGSSISGSMQMLFGDAQGSIISAIRLPINSLCIDSDNTNQTIYLGDYALQDGPTSYVVGQQILRNYIQFKDRVGIPTTFLDYRVFEPYTTLKLRLPFVGLVDISHNEFAGSIYIECVIELLTGKIIYTLYNDEDYHYPIATYTGQCGGNIPIASSQIANSSELVKSLTTGSLSLAAAAINPALGIAGSIGSIASAFYHTNQKSTNILGSYSGGYAEVITNRYEVIALKHTTAIEPSNLTAVEGRPLMAVTPLANLSGYVRTQGFSIDLNANSDVIRSINSKLDAGIYIE